MQDTRALGCAGADCPSISIAGVAGARRLGALIGILSVVAVFLLQQKLAARTDPQAPLEKVQMDPSMLAVLEKVDPPRGQPQPFMT